MSVLTTAHLFAWPVLRAMLAGGARQDAAEQTGAGSAGATSLLLPWRMTALREPVKPTSKRQVFRAARLNADGSASVIPWQGSGDLIHTASADGFVRLPLQDDELPAGTMVPFLAMVR